MKFLICGLGSIGRRHLRNLLALGERDILLYRTHQSTLPDDELPPFPVETDLQAALAHHPQAAIISNPTSLHLEVAIPAAEAGCHLLLEKPVSHSWERVSELQAAVQRGGGQVLVAYQFRFHPGLLRIATLISQGAIGKPLSARVHWGEYLPAWHPWEDYRQSYSGRQDLGGGVTLTLNHTLDYISWLLGEADGLWAFTGQAGLDLPVEDTAEIGLRFRNAAIASVHMDYNQRPPRHHLEITGSEGSLHWDNADGSVHLYRVNPGEWEIFPAPDGFERNHMFVDLMRHFISLAQREAQPVCSLDDGLRALRLSLAALESARHGQLVHL
jgi:predicted dehydrogenase